MPGFVVEIISFRKVNSKSDSSGLLVSLAKVRFSGRNLMRSTKLISIDFRWPERHERATGIFRGAENLIIVNLGSIRRQVIIISSFRNS